ncbi:element excision factor XisH family protein [Nostoc sp.]|uniref:element excision factor XisH family protein n=1 Tax=Nostoc sp. TaxID=1180 RepID=UPI002FF77B3F
MPAKDAFHTVVKTALQKDGWLITHDPYALQAGTLELYVVLGFQLPSVRKYTDFAVS